MNDERTTNSKVSLVTVGGIGILGTLLGVVATFFLTSPVVQKGQPRGTTPPANIHAIVTLYDSGKCQQRVGNIRYAFPVLRPHKGILKGDIIDWQGQEGRSSSGNTPGSSLSIDVEFNPQGPNVDTPFASHSFKSPTGTTNPTPPSGEPVGSASDYGYLSVTVDGVTCTTWDPGVHIDQ